MRDRLRRAQETVDDPGLAPHLGGDPSRLHRHQRQHARGGAGAKKPARGGEVAPPPPDEDEPDRQQRQRAGGEDHDVERPVDDGRGRAIGRRDAVEADDLGVGVESGQERRHVRHLDAAGRNAVLHVSAEALGDVGGGLGEQLDRGELDRLQLHHLADRAVTHHHLHRRGDGGDGEGDEESEAVQAIATALQHPDRVDRRHDEAGAQQARRAGSEPARAAAPG